MLKQKTTSRILLLTIMLLLSSILISPQIAIADEEPPEEPEVEILIIENLGDFTLNIDWTFVNHCVRIYIIYYL